LYYPDRHCHSRLPSTPSPFRLAQSLRCPTVWPFCAGFQPPLRSHRMAFLSLGYPLLIQVWDPLVPNYAVLPTDIHPALSVSRGPMAPRKRPNQSVEPLLCAIVQATHHAGTQPRGRCGGAWLQHSLSLLLRTQTGSTGGRSTTHGGVGSLH